MEYLRQIEEDLQNLSTEAGKKYSEVIDASNHALQALRIIRETYVSEIRKKESSNVSIKFKPSSELVSPYILVCNHTDCSARLMSLSVTGLLLLLKYDLVPAGDVQNILRVLQIQVQKEVQGVFGGSSKGGSGDSALKVLQLLVQLVTLLCADKQNCLLLSEQTIASLLTISLTLTEPRQPASITTAALGTTRQIIAIVMDAVRAATKELVDSGADLSTSMSFVWVLQSTSLVVKEMSLFMQGSAGGGGNLIRVTHVPQSFAMDVIYDILHGWKGLFHAMPSLQAQLHNSLIPVLQFMLKNIHSDFHALQQRFGLTTASSFTVRMVQIVRFIVLEFWSADEYDDLEHMITLLLHGMLPMRDQATSPQSSSSASSPFAVTHDDREDKASDAATTIRNRLEEASSLFSKFLSSTSSNTSSSSASLINTSSNASLTSRGAGSGKGSLTAGGSGAGGASASEMSEAFITVGRGMSAGMGFSASEGRVLPAHPAGCCLEALLSLLLSRSVHMLRSDVGIRCLLNLISHLATYSANLITSILSNDNLARDWERAVRDTPLLRSLQEIVEEETIELPDDTSFSSPPKTSEDVSGDKGVGANGVVAGYGDCGKALHQAIVSTNSLKATDVCLLALFSIMYAVKILLRMGVISKANESLPATSRLSDGSKYLFIPDVVDSLLLASLTSSESTNVSTSCRGDEEVAKRRIQSNEIIQLMRSHAENVYESILDSCTVVTRVCDSVGSDVIRCVNTITSQLAVLLGILGLTKPCEITISVICKQAIPLWHGKELLHSASGGGGVTRYNGLQWKHLQMMTSLLQLLHVMSDLISDWDCIVDCLEQFHNHYLHLLSLTQQQSPSSTIPLLPSMTSSQTVISPPLPPSSASQGGAITGAKAIAVEQMERLMTCIERWKDFTRSLSTETLIKLMTSLVALSMNNMALNSTSPAGPEISSNSNGTNPSTTNSNSNNNSNNSAAIVFDISDIKRSFRPTSTTTNRIVPAIATSAPAHSSSQKLSYLQRGVRSGHVSFSLQSVIEISKKNAFRISSIWQMVTSHLRMMASMKTDVSRTLSVMAIYDVIFGVIEQQGGDQGGVTIDQLGVTPSISRDIEVRPLPLQDLFRASFVWRAFFPSADHLFEQSAHPTTYRVRETRTQLGDSNNNSSSKMMPALSQSDILSCLKSLSIVRYVDVRVNILRGLEHFLQELGQCLSSERHSGGWKVVLELISSVPLSMTDEARQVEWNTTSAIVTACVSPSSSERRPSDVIIGMDNTSDASGNDPAGGGGPVLTLLPQHTWPRETLYDSFNCIVLIVDEFLDPHLLRGASASETPESSGDKDSGDGSDALLIQAVLESLSLFGSQRVDINTSLTAVEMIWKVADLALKAGTPSQRLVVMEVMLSLLFNLAMDERPELRHCAINTLFSAMSANSQMLQVEQWQRIFESIIFPLFEKTGERSKMAMTSREEAVAPELKKGVKINMHHSRDSAHKQWSETRVLTLRGMLRLLRTCTKLLLCEKWFHDIWASAVLVCDEAILVADFELEVAVAGVDVFFGMLGVVSDFASDDEVVLASAKQALLTSSVKAKTPATSTSLSQELLTLEIVEKSRAHLWQHTFQAVLQGALHCYENVDLAIALCAKLDKLYRANATGVFRYNANLRLLLAILIAIARPLLRPNHHSTLETTDGDVSIAISSKRGKGWARRGQEAELRRHVTSLFAIVKIADVSALDLYLSAISEIVFACRVTAIPIASEGSGNSLANKEIIGSQHGNASSSASFTSQRLSSASAELRGDLVKRLHSLLRPTVSPNASQMIGEGEGDEDVCSISLSLLQTGSPLTVARIIVQRFFADLCLPLLCRKLFYTSSLYEKEGSVSLYEGAMKLSFLLLTHAKYFLSLLAVNQQASLAVMVENLPTESQDRLALARRMVGLQYPTILSEENEETNEARQKRRWSYRSCASTETDIVLQAIRLLYPEKSSDSSAEVFTGSDDTHELVLLLLLTLLCPWPNDTRPDSHLPEVFACMSQIMTSPILRSRQRLQLLQVLLGSVLQTLFLLSSDDAELESERIEDISSLLQLTNAFCRSVLHISFSSTSFSEEMEIRQNAVYSLCMISRQLCKLLKSSRASSMDISVVASYFETLIELSSSDVNRDFSWSRDLVCEDKYYHLTSSHASSEEEREVWGELLSNVITIRCNASTPSTSSTSAYVNNLLHLVEDFCETDVASPLKAESKESVSSALKSAQKAKTADDLAEHCNRFPSEMNNYFPAMLLYPHLIDLLANTSLPQSLRQLAQTLLKHIDVVAILEMTAQLAKEKQSLEQQLQQTSQELKNLRSATAFPF